MRVTTILIGLVLGLSTNVQAVEPDVKCYADKVKETAKYSACLLMAESKAIKKSEAPDFSKCDRKYSEKWKRAESKAVGACITENDEAAIQAQVQQCVDDLVEVLGTACGVNDPTCAGPCDAGLTCTDVAGNCACLLPAGSDFRLTCICEAGTQHICIQGSNIGVCAAIDCTQVCGGPDLSGRTCADCNFVNCPECP